MQFDPKDLEEMTHRFDSILAQNEMEKIKRTWPTNKNSVYDWMEDWEPFDDWPKGPWP